MQHEVQRERTPRYLTGARSTRGLFTSRCLRGSALGILLVVVAVALLPGCASGPRVAYDEVQINLPFVGKKHVAVATLDQRASVKSGEHAPAFTGTLRSDSETAAAVATASGRSFADDVGEVVARGLGRSGYRVDTLTADTTQSPEQVFERLRATGASHLVLLVVHEWQTATFQNTEVRYDLELQVRNAAGALQGESRRRGSDQLEPTHADSDARERASQSALEQKLNLLFAERRVVAAFDREL